MISHLGPQLGVADGIALLINYKKNGKVTAVFTGATHPKEIFMKL
jgi:2-oxoisovalerate dehydrogenase E1 component